MKKGTEADSDLQVTRKNEMLRVQEYLQSTASYHELVSIDKAVRAGLNARYSYRKRCRPLYGNLPKSFNDEQLRLFFGDRVLRYNDNLRIVFLRQLFYGLRVSEACMAFKLPEQNIVGVWNEKMDRMDYLPLIPGTESLFAQELNYSIGYVAKYFREIVARQGLKYIYGHSTIGRPCTQFSNHTLRHTAGNLLYKSTNNTYKMHVYLRHETHSLYGATANYLRYDFDEMHADMEKVFSPYVASLLKSAPRHKSWPVKRNDRGWYDIVIPESEQEEFEMYYADETGKIQNGRIYLPMTTQNYLP